MGSSASSVNEGVARSGPLQFRRSPPPVPVAAPSVRAPSDKPQPTSPASHASPQLARGQIRLHLSDFDIRSASASSPPDPVPDDPDPAAAAPGTRSLAPLLRSLIRAGRPIHADPPPAGHISAELPPSPAPPAPLHSPATLSDLILRRRLPQPWFEHRRPASRPDPTSPQSAAVQHCFRGPPTLGGPPFDLDPLSITHLFNCFGQYFCLHFAAFFLGSELVYMASLRFMGEESEARKFGYCLEVMGES